MNVQTLRDIHSGKASLPLVQAQELCIAAQLNPDEYHRTAAIQSSKQHQRQQLQKILNSPGMSSIHRRRMMLQTLTATKEEQQNMVVEQLRRSKLGKHRCTTCQRSKRGVPHKVWLRSEHLTKAENLLKIKHPSRYNYCDCKNRIEEQWHVPELHSKCHGCLETKSAGLMSLLHCGHRVYCSSCIERHAFCPICTRRYVTPKDAPNRRLHQDSYRKKEENANALQNVIANNKKRDQNVVNELIRQKNEKRQIIITGQSDVITKDSYRKLIRFPSTMTEERIKRRLDPLRV